MAINCLEKKECNFPLSQSLYLVTTYWNCPICGVFSRPNQSTFQNWQIENFLMTLSSPWSSFGPILYCIILGSTRIHWISPSSASLKILVLALIITQTGTCNGSFDNVQLFLSLNDTNLIMKNDTRTCIRLFFYGLSQFSFKIIQENLDPLSILKHKKQRYKRFG